MADTGTLEALNNFTNLLKRAPLTTKVQKLRSMCLLPLLHDILGGSMKDYAMKDKCFWEKFISKCFPFLYFEKYGYVMDTAMYVGFSSGIPDEQTILNVGKEFDVTDAFISSERVTENCFWIVIPVNREIAEVKNLDFAGDIIPLDYFTRTSITVRNGEYSLYYVQTPVPFMSNYQIIIK